MRQPVRPQQRWPARRGPETYGMFKKTASRLAFGSNSFRFARRDFCAGIAPTALSCTHTDDSSSGFSLAMAVVHGMIRFRGLTLKNLVGISLCDLDQRFRPRLGHAEDSGSVVRRGKAAIDSDCMGHMV